MRSAHGGQGVLNKLGTGLGLGLEMLGSGVHHGGTRHGKKSREVSLASSKTSSNGSGIADLEVQRTQLQEVFQAKKALQSETAELNA